MNLAHFGLVFALCAQVATATDRIVADSGGDHTSIQAALDAAQPGDRVLVRARAGGAPWREKVVFRRGGSASAGFLELRNFPGEVPVIDGSGIPGPWMVTIDSLSFVRVAGLTFVRNDLPQGDGSGVRVMGSGQRIEVLENTFRDFTGDSSMAVTIYGTSTTGSLRDVVVRGNIVRNCQPAPSEAITLNGNVERFEVSGNIVEDVNYIGIDLIGGEASINPVYGARDGHVFGNRVLRARDTLFGGYAAGIYADGASRVLIERNHVAYCDQGIEVGAENPGWTSFDVVVRNNVVVANGKVGIAVGGYDVTVGRVVRARILHNTLFANAAVPGGGDTELWVNYADDTVVSGNVFVLGANPNALYNFAPTTNNVIDNNLWWRPLGAPAFEWLGQSYAGLASFRGATGFEVRGRFADPRLLAPLGADGVLGTLDDDLRPGATSPCIDAGDTLALGLDGLSDAAGAERFVDTATVGDSGIGLVPRPDLGAFERPRGRGEVARICPAAANSTGVPARLMPSGSTGLAAGPLALTVTGAPAGVFGYFVLGGGGAANPVGAGVLCVQGPLVRFPAQLVNAAGGAARTVAWAQVPPGGQPLVAGTTLVASFAYRDLVQGQVTFSFADALRWVLAP